VELVEEGGFHVAGEFLRSVLARCLGRRCRKNREIPS
jgi:hypothetical protein